MGRSVEMLVGFVTTMVVLGTVLAGHQRAAERWGEENERATLGDGGAVWREPSLPTSGLPLLDTFRAGVRLELGGRVGQGLRVGPVRVDAELRSAALETLGSWR